MLSAYPTIIYKSFPHFHRIYYYKIPTQAFLAIDFSRGARFARVFPIPPPTRVYRCKERIGIPESFPRPPPQTAGEQRALRSQKINLDSGSSLR